MQKRASPRDLSQMSRTLRDARRGTTLFFIFALTCLEALAQQGMPAGMRGWWYYDPNSPEKSGFAQTAAEGCRLNAANHFGQPLRAMLPSDSRKPSFDCYYAHTVGGEVHSYTATRLYCNEGYSEKWPGICVKFNETAHPPSCTPDQAAFAVGNPVVLYSGTKVQTETDLEGTPSGTLQVERIYRSVRESGKGQSGGPAWSFSFDRSLNLTLTSTGTPPSTVTGTFADGSYFEFQRQSSGTYVSAFDKRETLKSQSPTHDLWAITRSNGDVEIFKNLNKQYLLVSLHSKTGTGEFYSYSNDNKLEAISDSAGRRLAITWDDDAIAAISGATGTVRYRYDFDDVRNDSSYPGRRRLASVEFYDVTDRYLASRKYHYESPGYPYLLTGITDEKGVRFSTYTYNESGLAIVSEHAGGANRYKYQYLDGNTRIVTDPLGTERTIGLSYSSVSRISRVLNLSQPAGVGCDPGTTAFTYDSAGRKTSSTDFNDNKTCFVTDPVRGLVTTEVSGLTRSSTCPSSATSAIPANSRRISKLWHPDVPLEIAIASPGLVTRFFYNGQIGDNGDIESCAEGGALPNEKPLHVLCAKSEQPTSDLNGATGFSAVPLGSPRTWRYSYNATGQIIGISSPPSGLETPKWTQFFYYADTTDKHSKGDLAKILNSSGEVAEFLEYTNNGQVRKFKGNDGLVIQLEYGPRQRILSTTLETHNGDREPTQHFYDQVGQRIRTILPRISNCVPI